MTALVVSVLGVSVWGPGLEGWEASQSVLARLAAYHPAVSPAPPPAILAATERRRAGPVVRLALEVARAAAAASGLDPATLKSVFASGNGDGVVVGSILDTLSRATGAERVVSPTQFHNSVHNAAAGYWSIANGSREPATCLGAHDDTVAAGLLAAAVEVLSSGEPVLLVCYDHPLPPPLDALRPTGAAFGAGFVFGPPDAGPRRVTIAYRPDGTTLPAHLDPALDQLMRANAAARALPLLAALAQSDASSHALPYLDGRLTVDVGA